ncbi:hypothetical protein T492DRAFT_525438 [Pavlovales sp. CCMP2436]|nr:hypothetical protein T492DRAFT_525438 [Pavlovales sp. CCMP2436]
MAALFSDGRGLAKFLTQLGEFTDGVLYKLAFSNGAISDYCSSYLPGLEDQLFLHVLFNVIFRYPPAHLDQVDATQISLHRTGPRVSLAVAFVVEGGAGTRAMAMHFLDLLTTCDTSTSTWALQKHLAVTHPSYTWPCWPSTRSTSSTSAPCTTPAACSCYWRTAVARTRRESSAPRPPSTSSSTCSSRCRRTSRSPTTTSASRSGCSSASASRCCR